jgi:2'-hydroxyisoflavone reductase
VGPYAGVHQVQTQRAIAAGMTYRPLAETATDTLAWWNGLDEDRRNKMRAGLRMPPAVGAGPASLATQREAEAKLLEAWRAKA